MSHSSVMPAVLGGVKQYLWGTLSGPLGVAAADGKLLWQHARKFNVVIPPSPLAVNDELVFLTGPYDAGSVMVRVRKVGAEFKTETAFDFKLLAADPLKRARLAKTDFTAVRLQDQCPVRFNAGLEHAVELQPDNAGVRDGSNIEIVFKVPIGTMVSDGHAGVNFFKARAPVQRDVTPPTGRILAD